MKNTCILYRPVGLYEMEWILNANASRFPPRKPEQPFFYPVLTHSYAQHIAREWNANNSDSGFAGFVTQFFVMQDYVDKHEEHTVGSSEHRELWIPAESLDEFNRHIIGQVTIADAYYGNHYTGIIPEKFLLRERTATEQLIVLGDILEYNGMDFISEIIAHKTIIQLNFAYWKDYAFRPEDIAPEQREKIIQAITNVWRNKFPQTPLCGLPQAG
ncbi:MAG: hypothetical protein MI924_25010 [Chloroflexales bacterium]|nr:hypothetical protein [Chloroflexales bacterium]